MTNAYTIKLVPTIDHESGPLGDAWKEWTLVVDGIAYPEAMITCDWKQQHGWHYIGKCRGCEDLYGRRAVMGISDDLKPRSAKAAAAKLVKIMDEAGLLNGPGQQQ